MEQNPLTVSTANPFPCDETLSIAPGSPCMTHNSIQVLEKSAVSHSEYLITHQAAKHIKNRNVGKTKKDQ